MSGVFDDYRYSQRIAVLVRWFLLAAWFAVHNYRADYNSQYFINNGMALGLSALNAYVHWRIWKRRPVTMPYVLALSAMDLTFITVGIVVTTRFDNTFFVLYYPAILGLALVSPSRRLSFGGVALVAIAYSAVSIGLDPGVDFDLREEKVLLIRILTMFAVVAAGALVVRIERDRRREAVEAGREQAERNIALERRAREADEAAREERDSIARDIHDGIAQSIYALSLSIETAAELAEREGSVLKDHLRKLVPVAKKTLLETRHYIYNLKPLLSGTTDLQVMAENQVREFGSVSGTPAGLRIEGDPAEVSVAVATGLYRILQEALANVLKHAQASQVDVVLTFDADSVELIVQDDGVGFDAGDHGLGYGLDNMRQRAVELEGKIEISGAPGKGTRIEVTLPAKGGKS